MMTVKAKQFKVGDKVRVLDVSKIDGAEDFFTNNDVFVIKYVNELGGLGTNRVCDGEELYIATYELRYIEKVVDAKVNTNYKTVKRKANVGERILVTDADVTYGDYENGSVLTVSEVDGELGVRCHVGTVEYYYLLNEEYEVIIDDSERITALETQVAELPAELQALKKRKKPKYLLNDLLAKYPTPNEQRKAVIERAKAFVADTLTKKASKSHDGAIVVGVYVAMPKFFVNAEKRVVTFVAVSPKYKHKRAKAIAKCAPDDVFNADIGKAIALGRALGLDVSELENAPKPTEVVVGMVVDTYIDGDFFKTVKPMKVIEGHRMYSNLVTAEYTPYDPGDKIIDDTEAQY